MVTIYLSDIRYVMEHLRTILDRANQALQTLEKFKERLNHVSTSLSALEFEDAVTLHDVLSVVQRLEMVLVIVQEIERYIIELGTEGRLIRLQLEMMMLHVREDREALLADYLPELTPEKLKEAREGLGALRSDDLLSLARLGQILGYEPGINMLETAPESPGLSHAAQDTAAAPGGHRRPSSAATAICATSSTPRPRSWPPATG